jgi:hypothetical protein
MYPRRVATIESAGFIQSSLRDARIVRDDIQAMNDLPTFSRSYGTKKA